MQHDAHVGSRGVHAGPSTELLAKGVGDGVLGALRGVEGMRQSGTLTGDLDGEGPRQAPGAPIQGSLRKDS